MPRRGVDLGISTQLLGEYNAPTPCPVPKHLKLLYCSTTCVPLIVGSQERRFEVHKNRLFTSSSWFETVLSSGMKETSMQQIPLPEDDPMIVELFVQWLYTASPNLSACTDETFTELAHLYEFAQRLNIRELKNYIVWKLFELRRQAVVPPISTVSYALTNLSENASFRKIMVAWFTWHLESARTLTTDDLTINPQFAVELILSMVRKQDGARDILAGSPEGLYENDSAGMESDWLV